MVHLAPFNPPLGPILAQCHPEPVTLHMKEKAFSLTGDDFTVKTVAGMEVCKCKGKMLSISDKKVFTDIAGHELFALKNKLLSIHKSFHGVDPKGHDLFEVHGHFSLLSSKSSCTFTNASNGAKVELEIKGDWFDRSADITYGGAPVAHISRSIFNVREMFADKQTYFVTVAPNVDLTLIAALCVCLDEKENEK